MNKIPKAKQQKDFGQKGVLNSAECKRSCLKYNPKK